MTTDEKKEEAKTSNGNTPPKKGSGGKIALLCLIPVVLVIALIIGFIGLVAIVAILGGGPDDGPGDDGGPTLFDEESYIEVSSIKDDRAEYMPELDQDKDGTPDNQEAMSGFEPWTGERHNPRTKD